MRASSSARTVRRQCRISWRRPKSSADDLQKRAERAVKDLEERGQRIVALIEKQAEKGVEPIVRGLNLPTREEMEKLKKRMAQLEKRLDEIAGSKAA